MKELEMKLLLDIAWLSLNSGNDWVLICPIDKMEDIAINRLENKGALEAVEDGDVLACKLSGATARAMRIGEILAESKSGAISFFEDTIRDWQVNGMI